MSNSATLEAPVQVMNLTDASEITVEFKPDLTVADILAAAGVEEVSAVINGRPAGAATVLEPGTQVVLTEKIVNG